MHQIEFTAEKFEAFKAAYATAVNLKQDTFLFEGNEVYTNYGKYVIEYLESKIKNTKL